MPVESDRTPTQLTSQIMNDKIASKKTNRIAVLKASWHSDIVDRAVLGFTKKLEANEWFNGEIEIFELPGAFELPLQAQLLAKTGTYQAIVACALVVDGGIYRHDFVASSVIDGLMRVQLDTGTPVISTVMTPHNFHDCAEHRDFFAAHFEVKGREAAQVCLQLLGKPRQRPAMVAV